MAQSIAELDESLDKFEEQIGLSRLIPDGKEHIVNTYLNYSWEELEKTDAQGCAIMHYEVSSFLVSLQRVVNRLEAKLKFAGDSSRMIQARLDRLKFLNFPLKNLLKSLEMLHDSKQIEKKEDLYERRLHQPRAGEHKD